MSAYYLEHATVHQVQKHFNIFEEEAHSLLALGLPIPAYVSSINCLLMLKFNFFSKKLILLK